MQKFLRGFPSGIPPGISTSNLFGNLLQNLFQRFPLGISPGIFLKNSSRVFLQKFFRRFCPRIYQEFFQGFSLLAIPPENCSNNSSRGFFQEFIQRYFQRTPPGVSLRTLPKILYRNSSKDFQKFIQRFRPGINWGFRPDIHQEIPPQIFSTNSIGVFFGDFLHFSGDFLQEFFRGFPIAILATISSRNSFANFVRKCFRTFL